MGNTRVAAPGPATCWIMCPSTPEDVAVTVAPAARLTEWVPVEMLPPSSASAVAMLRSWFRVSAGTVVEVTWRRENVIGVVASSVAAPGPAITSVPSPASVPPLLVK
jgi:hypothetical protein